MKYTLIFVILAAFAAILAVVISTHNRLAQLDCYNIKHPSRLESNQKLIECMEMIQSSVIYRGQHRSDLDAIYGPKLQPVSDSILQVKLSEREGEFDHTQAGPHWLIEFTMKNNRIDHYSIVYKGKEEPAH